MGIHVEATKYAEMFLVSLKHYDKTYRGKSYRKIDDWEMNDSHIKLYEADPEVHYVRFAFDAVNWRW